MPADANHRFAALRAPAETPAARRDAPRAAAAARSRGNRRARAPRSRPRASSRAAGRAVERPEATAIPAPALAALGLFALLPLALIVGGYWYVTGGQVMSTDNAYVEADKVGISTDVSGIVKEVDVDDNQQVDAGQVLFRLDDLPFRLALDRAEAQVGIVAQRSQRAQGELPGHAGADQAGAGRYRLLRSRIPSSAGSRGQEHRVAADLRHRAAQSAERAAEARLAQRSSSPRSPPSSTAIPTSRSSSIRAICEAVAQRDEAARQLDHTVVKAPFAGIVTNVPSLAPGKYLAASTTAFYLVATDHVWVDANPKETELTYVRPGQPVTVTVDTYPGRWNGTAPSRASARRRRRSSRCCRRRTPAATGSRSCSASRCACASTPATRAGRRCAPG